MSQIISKIVETKKDFPTLIIRFALGAMILPHAMFKLFGSFGGLTLTQTIGFFQTTWGIPAILTICAVFAEFLGGMALISGFGTRIAAALIGFDLLVAAVKVHLQYGFFMNWLNTQKGEGIEFFILVFAMVAVLIINGGGSCSLDLSFSKNLKTKESL